MKRKINCKQAKYEGEWGKLFALKMIGFLSQFIKSWNDNNSMWKVDDALGRF